MPQIKKCVTLLWSSHSGYIWNRYSCLNKRQCHSVILFSVLHIYTERFCNGQRELIYERKKINFDSKSKRFFSVSESVLQHLWILLIICGENETVEVWLTEIKAVASISFHGFTMYAQYRPKYSGKNAVPPIMLTISMSSPMETWYSVHLKSDLNLAKASLKWCNRAQWESVWHFMTLKIKWEIN